MPYLVDLVATYWAWLVGALILGGAAGFGYLLVRRRRSVPARDQVAARSPAEQAVAGAPVERVLPTAAARAADVKAADEARRADEAKAAEDARRAAEAKAADDARRAADAKAAEAKAAETKAADAHRAAEAKAAEAKAAETKAADARRAAETKAAEDARRAAEAKAAEAKAADARRAAEDTRRATETKAAEAKAADARRAVEANAPDIKVAAGVRRTAEDARRAAQAKAIHDARRAAQAKATEDARRAAGAKAADDPRRPAEARAAEARAAEVVRRAVPAAAAAYPGKKPPGLPAPQDGQADDLTLVKGIGPKNKKICNELGVFHFSQISDWTSDEATWVGHHIAFPGRIEREHWIAQARLLAAGGDTAHSAGVRAGAITVDDTADAPLDAAAAAALGDSLPVQAPPVEGESDHPGRRPYGLAAPSGGPPDDLKRIKGIGPKNEDRLHALGIWRFAQIAAWTPENVKWVGSYLAFAGRIERERWIAQAQALVTRKS